MYKKLFRIAERIGFKLKDDATFKVDNGISNTRYVYSEKASSLTSGLVGDWTELSFSQYRYRNRTRI